MTQPLTRIRAAYEAVKDRCAQDWIATASGDAIRHLAVTCLRFLTSECSTVDLKSNVPGKNYISFVRGRSSRQLSRPANRALFLANADAAADLWDTWVRGNLSQGNLAKVAYTVALAPCLAMELFDRQNKKGPATYFECLIGHLFARTLGVNPRKQASLSIEGRPVRLTMDFLFEMTNGLRVHVPVKMSTRERVVQAWAHQRILDGAFGVSAYKGIMVLFSETKLGLRSQEVVEICVPDQWLAYQALLSKMERIYYFDVPDRYQTLTDQYSALITVKPFPEFFTERGSVLRP
jgi:hypothetical protein